MLYPPSDILAAARELEPTLRDIRRDLHRHPELGFQEFRTTDKIKDILSTLPGVELLPLACETGAIALVRGSKGGRTIGLRCDIDALPIQEKNTHGFVSETPGLMHACGHDGHVAILLGAAMLLSRFRPERDVRLLFQPAEESSPDGAPAFIEAGALDGLDCVWGFHLNATSDFGNVGWHDGPVMAGAAGIKVTIHGKSGHSAYPEACVNPVDVLSRVWVETSAMKQCVRGTRPYVITLSSFLSGVEFCPASPDTATMTCRLRYHEMEVRDVLLRRFRETVRHFSELYGATYEVETLDYFPITYNDPSFGGLVREHARDFGLPVEEIPASMGSDDFGYYSQRIPSYYMTFGIRKGADFPIAHTPFFNFDEAILPPSAAMFASCAL